MDPLERETAPRKLTDVMVCNSPIKRNIARDYRCGVSLDAIVYVPTRPLARRLSGHTKTTQSDLLIPLCPPMSCLSRDVNKTTSEQSLIPIFDINDMLIAT